MKEKLIRYFMHPRFCLAEVLAVFITAIVLVLLLDHIA